ncbi:OmpA family protein [Aurantiacibacter aquimixticola]|nr:OmpA family protein [Aurantiacibacter aquimixticola]
MTNRLAIRALTLAALGASALALAACDVRRDSDAEEPAPTATPSETASPDAETTPSPSATPVQSILRDETAPEQDTVLPAQPIELVIPFPDGADIGGDAERMLAGVIGSRALEEEDWQVILRGHTDSSGNDQANLRASRARAEAVAAWLVERGVDDDRIKVIAFGEQNPIAPNALPDGSANEEGRRENRRVELTIEPEGGAQDDRQSDATGGDAQARPTARPSAARTSRPFRD